MAPLRSFLNRLTWALFKKRCVGIDLHGNSYYIRIEKSLEGTDAEKRFVKFAKGTEHYDYQPNLLPPDWMAWLNGTRDDPPSDDEIAQTDKKRYQKMDLARQVDESDKLEAWLFKQKGKASGTSIKTPMLQVQRDHIASTKTS